MDTWVQVEKLKDGDSANAETLNTPIDQLASRTEYLKRRLGSIMDNGFQSALILNDVDLAADELDRLEVGAVVYMDKKGLFRLAQAKMHLYDSFTADESAFTIGVLVSASKPKGDVLIYGKLDLGSDPLFKASDMLQSGESFEPGRYYLSATEPGRITAKPGGPLIYIGSFHSEATSDGEFAADAMACINPQFMDIGTSHVHRAYPLVARPAGVLQQLSGERVSVLGHLPDAHDGTGPYPSLVFGGTWMPGDGRDVTYTLMLEGSDWGNLRLVWKKGASSFYRSVDVPAPGVFVDLDNGLKAKIRLPAASNSSAGIGSLRPKERTWTLSFPEAGKGWVDHSVDTVATVVSPQDSSDSSSDDDSGSGTLPALRVLLSGAWPHSSNSVYCAFPTALYWKSFSEGINAGRTVEVGGVIYEFVASGGAPSEESYVPVQCGATTEESLHNLAAEIDKGLPASQAPALVGGDILYMRDGTIDGSGYDGSAPGFDFNVVGGTIGLMVVYTDDYYIVGDPVISQPTYSPLSLTPGLTATVYAEGASAGQNCTCLKGTVLHTTAYDYAPDAVYDYVMGLHQSVDYHYPPVPAQAAGLFVNGVEMESSALFPLNPTYAIGRRTLHWMEDDPEHLPWPDGVTSRFSKVDPADDKTMVFHFVVGFQCATGPVTSITPAPGAPIKIYTYGTEEKASTGDVMIDAALDFSVSDANVGGYKVAKQGKSGKLLAGPVVERIIGGNGVRVTQAAGCPPGQGTVTIGLDDGTLRNHFNEIALENAKQEKLGLFPYVSLLGWGGSYGTIPSAFTVMMRVPASLSPEQVYRLQLRTTMFGAVGFSGSQKRVAGLQLEYNILPDFTNDSHLGLKTGLVAPPVPRRINVPLGHLEGGQYEYTAYDPFVATTDIGVTKADDVCVALSDLPIPAESEIPGFTLKPGYLVAVRLSRTAATGTGGTSGLTEYTGPLGFLSMEWELKEA